MAAPRSNTYRGWYNDAENSTLDLYIGYGGASDPAEAATFTSSAATFAGTVTAASGVTATAGGVTVTAGDLTVTAGDSHVVAQNLYMGAETAFGTTEPTSAVVFKQGTAFAGAITTSSGIQSNGTLLRKIIADGTVSNVG